MKTVIEMAREVGLIDFRDPLSGEYAKAVIEDLTAFAELVRADAIATEREACAKVCEPQEEHDDPLTAWKIATAIRNRSNT
jgi:hypothetical protein